MFYFVGSTFILVFLAEMGDKTQLVCMTLAARHKGLPVVLGAILAFSVLNVLAVFLGGSLGHLIPVKWMVVIVAVIFAIFGLHALFSKEVPEGPFISGKKNHSVFLTTFLLILVSELGDKTQISVAGLSSTIPGLAVWLGATLALSATSVIGVFAGRVVLRRISPTLLKRLSGVVFLLLAVLMLLSRW